MNLGKVKQINRAMKSLIQKGSQYSANELRVIVALERAIARIESHQELAKNLIFKGGFVLFKVFESQRFTRDADALAVSIPKEKLKKLVCEALARDLDDGVWFGDIQVIDLESQGEYGSYRFDCAFQIGEPDLKKIHKLSRVHLDISFNDRLLNSEIEQLMSSILENEQPMSWKVYPIEFIIAEKLETLYDRGSANSRAKDIYDLNYLMPRCLDQAKLASAIRETFKNRKTQLPISFVERVEDFDRTILKAAWPGIKVLSGNMIFDDAWDMLINHLGSLDGFFG